MLSMVTFVPDGIITDHAHPHEQRGVLISGGLEFTVGGLTHRVRALDGPAVALEVFHPIREDYL